MAARKLASPVPAGPLRSTGEQLDELESLNEAIAHDTAVLRDMLRSSLRPDPIHDERTNPLTELKQTWPDGETWTVPPLDKWAPKPRKAFEALSETEQFAVLDEWQRDTDEASARGIETQLDNEKTELTEAFKVWWAARVENESVRKKAERLQQQASQ